MPAALWAAIVPAAIGMPDFGRSLSAAGEENDFPALFAAAGEERAGRAA